VTARLVQLDKHAAEVSTPCFWVRIPCCLILFFIFLASFSCGHSDGLVRNLCEASMVHINGGKSMKILLGEGLCCIRLVQLKESHATFFSDASAQVRLIFRAPMTASVIEYRAESDCAREQAEMEDVWLGQCGYSDGLVRNSLCETSMFHLCKCGYSDGSVSVIDVWGQSSSQSSRVQSCNVVSSAWSEKRWLRLKRVPTFSCLFVFNESCVCCPLDKVFLCSGWSLSTPLRTCACCIRASDTSMDGKEKSLVLLYCSSQ